MLLQKLTSGHLQRQCFSSLREVRVNDCENILILDWSEMVVDLNSHFHFNQLLNPAERLRPSLLKSLNVQEEHQPRLFALDVLSSHHHSLPHGLDRPHQIRNESQVGFSSQWHVLAHNMEEAKKRHRLLKEREGLMGNQRVQVFCMCVRGWGTAKEQVCVWEKEREND